MDPVVPQSIPQFSKRLRHCSRLSEGWSVASAQDGVNNDMHYIPRTHTMVHDTTHLSMHVQGWGTSTPLPSGSMDIVNKDSSWHNNQDIRSSLCLDHLDNTKDSGRWSMDTLDCENQSELPLPRLSLESKFDAVLQDDHDSAYESEFNSHASDLASSCDCLSVTLEKASIGAVINKVLKNFTPVEPDRLIGRHMGKEQVDIIGELNLRNMHSVIGLVLNYVNDKDLCTINCVNSHWRNACCSDKTAKMRRSSYMKSQQSPLSLQKENITVRRRKSSQKRSLTQASCLGEVQIAVDGPTCQSAATLANSPSWEEAANMIHNDESLCKCPRCSSPSRVLPVQERAQCTRCSHDFCTQCLLAFHGSTSCSVTIRNKKSKTDSSVGTRKSKRNLRRL